MIKRDKRIFNISTLAEVYSAHFDGEDFVNQEGQWETTVNSRISPLWGFFIVDFCMGAYLKGSYSRVA